MDGAAAALHELATCERWAASKVAVASRTNKAAWARSLLRDFEVPGCTGRSIASLLAQAEIFTGDKTAHFANLRSGLGVAYEDMMCLTPTKHGTSWPIVWPGRCSVTQLG